MAKLTEYYWMVVLAVIAGFVMAFGIGANDCANSFASSVSAKSLTLAQAIVVASIFEFLGAVSIGKQVTGTIRGKIIKPSLYKDEPEIMMFGQLTALIIASIWLLVASWLEYPVSTTHTIIAAVIGFSLSAKGFDSIDWKETGKVFASWVASPLFSGTISCFFFYCVKTFVLEHENTFERAMKVYPVVLFVGVGVNMFFVLFKINNVHIENYGHVVVIPATFGSATLVAVLFQVFGAPFLRARVTRQHEEHLAALAAEAERKQQIQESTENPDESSDKEKQLEKEDAEAEKKPSFTDASPGSIKYYFDLFASKTFRQDLQTMSLNENATAKDIWAHTDLYDAKTERLFSYLQVFTAIMTSFAHGGNDVANAIAPLSSVIQIYQDGKFNSKADTPKWQLAMGGAGISCGFIFFGYNVIKALGYKLVMITPSRGFCIELATAGAVASATFMQLPVSSTQCLVGATCGAGFAAAGVKGVGWMYLCRTMFGWFAIFFVSCIVTAGVFAYCIFSPSVVNKN